MRIETIMVGQMGTNCYLAWDEESKRGFLVDPGEQADRTLKSKGNSCDKYDQDYTCNGNDLVIRAFLSVISTAPSGGMASSRTGRITRRTASAAGRCSITASGRTAP